MSYEIWDTETANLVGDYPTEAEALNVVIATAAHDGEERVLAWALAREDRHGKTATVAAGRDLVERARMRHSSGPAA